MTPLKALIFELCHCIFIYTFQLTLLEEISKDPAYSQALDKFTSKSADVHLWLFVPWINQILSMFGGCNKLIGLALGPILVRVADKYAESLRFPFQFTLEHIQKSGVESRPFVRELELKLKSFKLLDQVLWGTYEWSGFRMIPDFKRLDFGSPLYGLAMLGLSAETSAPKMSKR